MVKIKTLITRLYYRFKMSFSKYKSLKNNLKTRDYLSSLPKIYLIVLDNSYGVREFALYGYKLRKHEVEPYIYYYYDANGMRDEYVVVPLAFVTTGSIITWMTNKKLANSIADALNIWRKQNEEQRLKQINDSKKGDN